MSKKEFSELENISKTFDQNPINININILLMYWVVRKVRADFEGKLKRRRFKFLISFIKFKSFAARTFRTTQSK